MPPLEVVSSQGKPFIASRRYIRDAKIETNLSTDGNTFGCYYPPFLVAWEAPRKI
jgi:hypothetical protein